MKKQASRRNHLWLPIIVLALGFALAFGGCARGVPASSGSAAPNTQNTSASTQSGSGSSDVNALQQLDQQNQNDLDGLNNDQNNASQNTGGETGVVP